MRELKLGLNDFKLSKQVQVFITDPNGKENAISFSLHDTVRLLKEKALGDKFGKDASVYKLILVRSRKSLEDSRTLQQEEVQDNDEFILWKRRIEGANVSLFQKVPLSNKGPDLTTVKKLTLSLGTDAGESSSEPGVPMLYDFFAGLKKILTSLTEVASLLQFIKSDDKEEMDVDVEDPTPEVDKVGLKQLMDMGFSEARCTKALYINKMDAAQAMDWLLQHDQDPGIDTPLTLDEIQCLYPTSVPLKPVKKVGKREFVPNPRAIHNLRDMGFEEEDVIKALRISGNHQESALDWLLGDRQGMDENAEGLEGLDPESPIYHAIMNHPVVQLGMTNPRILHAFVDMLENPGSITQYINDPEIGPVLLQISRIVQTFSR